MDPNPTLVFYAPKGHSEEGWTMFLLSLGGSLFRSSTKLALSFVLVIVLLILAFAFAPSWLRSLQDWIEVIYDHIRTPPILDDQEMILYRTMVNEKTIFGILMTLLARAIIEVFAYIFGKAFGKEDDVKSGKAK